jgi:hypothetical protein
MGLIERIGRALLGVSLHDVRQARLQIQRAGRVSELAGATTTAGAKGKSKVADRLSDSLRHAAGRLTNGDPADVR